jgi:hypothetical protein
MIAPYPVGYTGDGLTRGVTLALPTAQVRSFLCPGLQIGEQQVTPPGTHPVILQFHDYSRCRLSVPTLLPDMQYREQTLSIPFTYVTGAAGANAGPYVFMPQLYLDHSFVTVAGFAFWGFGKTMAQIGITPDRYTVSSPAGTRLASLTWKLAANGHATPAAYPAFEPIRQMLSQPLISMLPAAAGPFRVLTDFHRNWQIAVLRPLHTVLEIDAHFAPGLDSGRHPSCDWSSGIDTSPLGSFELWTPWFLSFPYSPAIALRP